MVERVCDAVHAESGARCYKDISHRHDGTPHTGYSHYPGQVVTWEVSRRTLQEILDHQDELAARFEAAGEEEE